MKLFPGAGFRRGMVLLLTAGCLYGAAAGERILKHPVTGRPVAYGGKFSNAQVSVPDAYRPKAREMRGVWVATVENIDFPAHNSAAAFALTDKLERIVFVFSEVETVIERESFIEACSDFENILDSDNWYVEIQSKMSYNIDPEEFIERIKK